MFASNYERSYNFEIVGVMPENAWVGIELASAARMNSTQLIYR